MSAKQTKECPFPEEKMSRSDRGGLVNRQYTVNFSLAYPLPTADAATFPKGDGFCGSTYGHGAIFQDTCKLKADLWNYQTDHYHVRQ